MTVVNAEELLFQVFLIGDSGGGKSSLLERFGKDTFTESYTPTSGVDISVWNVPVDETTVKLQINDTSGRKEQRTAIPDYCKSAHGFVIVFDITDKTALSGVTYWLCELEKLANKNVPKILVGNKQDMQAERAITCAEAKGLASKWGIKFMEASAKDGGNVPQIFLKIAAQIKSCLQPQVNGSGKKTEFVEIKRRLEDMTGDRLRSGDNPLPFPPKPKKREECDYTFNITLLGDIGVGKSSLMLRFTEDNFSLVYKETIGLDFRMKMLELEGHTVKLLITDTAGQERFRCLTSSFYRGADGIIIVYDVTCRESFTNLKGWMEAIERYAREDCNKILVGTKSDLTDKAVVNPREAQKWAKEFDMPFFEASAKNATNVEEVFNTMTRLIKKRAGPPRSRNSRAGHEDVVVLGASQKARRCC
ncbi:uncharacterized protein LOC144148177 isoform X3 [Haemaphysalis longicornis]